MTDNGSGWSLPGFAKVGIVGVLCFLVLFLVGAIPYLPHPMRELQAQVLKDHQDMTRSLRQICAGIWRDDPGTQRECWK